MENKISISFPFETQKEYEENQKRIIREVLGEKLSDNLINKPNPEYLTRKQLAAKLHLSLPTIFSLTKSGILKGYKIQGRVLYKFSEVDSALEPIETLKNKRGE